MEHLQDMFIERGFTVKESKECGAGGSMVRYSFLWQGGHGGPPCLHQCFQCPLTQYAFQALLTMASPEEALRALAVMHNYAPEEYKVCLGEGNISFSLSVPT